MATRDPLVSVVIGSYNYGHFIEEAIDSVRNQNFPLEKVEIIVVDDGSTDDTRERLRKYAGEVRYIYKENGGQATAFNTGIGEARGEIVALLDADDLWHRDKLSSVVREFESDPAVDVVHHYMEVVGPDRQLIGVIPDAHAQAVSSISPRPLASYLNGKLPFTPPTSGMSIRADCLRKLTPIPEEYRICADLYILSLLPFYAREFRLVARPLGCYRIHGANTWTGPSGAPKPEAMIRFLRITFKYIEETAREFGQDASRLKRTWEAMEAELTIELYKRDRHWLAALRAASRLDDPNLDGHRLTMLKRRAVKMLSIIIPGKMHLALRQRWRPGRLSGIHSKVCASCGDGNMELHGGRQIAKPTTSANRCAVGGGEARKGSMALMIRRLIPRSIMSAARKIWVEYPSVRYVTYFAFDTLDRVAGRRETMVPPRRMMFDGPQTIEEFKRNGEEYLRYYLDLCHLKPTARILDVGSGIGRKTIPLTKYLDGRGSYEGLEIVKAGVDWCRKTITPRFPNFHFQRADVFNKFYNPRGRYKGSEYRFPFEDESFDFVVLNSVMTHLLPPDTMNYIGEISRVLRKGGKSFITFFLLNQESRAGLDSGTSTMPFVHEMQGVLILDPKQPENGVAYEESFLRDLYRKHALEIEEPIRYGSWSGRSDSLTYQDIIIASKS